MKKTINTRVLEITARKGYFNREVAKRSFRNYDSEQLHNSVMSAARKLAQKGLLYNHRGNFTLTNRGIERVNS